MSNLKPYHFVCTSQKIFLCQYVDLIQLFLHCYPSWSKSSRQHISLLQYLIKIIDLRKGDTCPLVFQSMLLELFCRFPRHRKVYTDYLLRGELRPMCCNTRLTVRHVLLSCAKYAHIRRKYFAFNSLFELFRDTPAGFIIQFLRECNLYYMF